MIEPDGDNRTAATCLGSGLRYVYSYMETEGSHLTGSRFFNYLDALGCAVRSFVQRLSARKSWNVRW